MNTSIRQLRKLLPTLPTTVVLAGALLITGSGLTAFGTDTFTVVPSESSVSISGSVLGAPITAQGPGSLTAQYSGSVLVNVGNGVIQFPGQSQVIAVDSGSWQPLSDGSAGSASANYGATASYSFGTGVAAARDIVADLTSGTVGLVNGQFDTQGITCTIPDTAVSSAAYRLQGFINTSGTVSLAGNSATGETAQGSLVTVGNVQILTIPINYTFYFSLVSTNDTVITLTGQLVATHTL